MFLTYRGADLKHLCDMKYPEHEAKLALLRCTLAVCRPCFIWLRRSDNLRGAVAYLLQNGLDSPVSEQQGSNRKAYL